MPDLYYLVFWKSYPEKEIIWEPSLVIKHLCKLVIIFHKEFSVKLTAISPTINFSPPIARLIVKYEVEISTNQKCDQLAKANSSSQRAKKCRIFSFYLIFSSISIVGKKVLPQLRDPLPKDQFFNFSSIFNFSHLYVFFLSINQKIFVINYLALSAFSHLFPRDFEGFL